MSTNIDFNNAMARYFVQIRTLAEFLENYQDFNEKYETHLNFTSIEYHHLLFYAFTNKNEFNSGLRIIQEYFRVHRESVGIPSP